MDELEFDEHLSDILQLLWTIFDADTDKIVDWLYLPNSDWFFRTPIDLIQEGRSHTVLKHLIYLSYGNVYDQS